MKGIIEVTATRGGKTIEGEVYGDLAERDKLFARLMNKHKVIHSQRLLWKLSNVKLIKEINDR
tara:strand:- start:276 stop:464 length:189 start_codon:yes stop_codon:yes gene_type:complete